MGFINSRDQGGLTAVCHYHCINFSFLLTFIFRLTQKCRLCGGGCVKIASRRQLTTQMSLSRNRQTIRHWNNLLHNRFHDLFFAFVNLLKTKQSIISNTNFRCSEKWYHPNLKNTWLIFPRTSSSLNIHHLIVPLPPSPSANLVGKHPHCLIEWIPHLQ